MGVGTADADARSTKAKLEADTSTMYCESQRRRERIGVCMLSLVRRSAHRKVNNRTLRTATCLSNGHRNEVSFAMSSRRRMRWFMYLARES